MPVNDPRQQPQNQPAAEAENFSSAGRLDRASVRRTNDPAPDAEFEPKTWQLSPGIAATLLQLNTSYSATANLTAAAHAAHCINHAFADAAQGRAESAAWVGSSLKLLAGEPAESDGKPLQAQLILTAFEPGRNERVEEQPIAKVIGAASIVRQPDGSGGASAVSRLVVDPQYAGQCDALLTSLNDLLPEIAAQGMEAMRQNQAILPFLRWGAAGRPPEAADPANLKRITGFRRCFGFAERLADLPPIDRSNRYADGLTPAQRACPAVEELAPGLRAYVIRPGIEPRLLVESMALIEETMPREADGGPAWLMFYMRACLGFNGVAIDDPALWDHGLALDASLGAIYTRAREDGTEKVIGVGGLYGYADGPQDAMWGGQLSLTEESRRNPTVVAGVFSHILQCADRLAVRQIYLFTEDQEANQKIQQLYEGFGGMQIRNESGEMYLADYVDVTQRFYHIPVENLRERLSRWSQRETRRGRQ